jgi:hypothetical protein
MKKRFFIILIASVFLASCGASGSLSERQAKEMESRLAKLEADVLNIKVNSGKVKESPVEVKKEEIVSKVEEEIKGSYVEEKKEEVVVAKPEPKVFEITEPKEGANLTKEPITFSGIIDERAVKISVKYSGIDNSEDYTLKNFKEGDTSFWYKASPSFKNLAKGKNTYEFRAEFNDGDIITLEPIVINYK